MREINKMATLVYCCWVEWIEAEWPFINSEKKLYDILHYQLNVRSKLDLLRNSTTKLQPGSKRCRRKLNSPAEGNKDMFSCPTWRCGHVDQSRPNSSNATDRRAPSQLSAWHSVPMPCTHGFPSILRRICRLGGTDGTRM